MEFCLFNNVAIAAQHALDVHGMQQVAMVDFDVHHGNGTEAAFKHDERVLMVSLSSILFILIAVYLQKMMWIVI